MMSLTEERPMKCITDTNILCPVKGLTKSGSILFDKGKIVAVESQGVIRKSPYAPS